MNFKLVMDRGSVLGSLFGGPISFRRVWMRAKVERRGAGAALLTISFSGWGKAVDSDAHNAYATEIHRYEQETLEAAEQLVATGALDRAMVREVVIKEVVRIPCKYCGSLVENTARKCLDCGAPLT